MYQVSDRSGRRFVVTGANSGTGKEAARRLAARRARTPSWRCEARNGGRAAAADIRRDVPGASLEVRRIDLAGSWPASGPLPPGSSDDGACRSDVLINNAGVMAVPQRMTTVDGFELQFGGNCPGPFALTFNLVLPLLLAAVYDSGVSQRCPAAPPTTAASTSAICSSPAAIRPATGLRGQSRLADMHGARACTSPAVADDRGWNSQHVRTGYTRTNLQTSDRISVGSSHARHFAAISPRFHRKTSCRHRVTCAGTRQCDRSSSC